MRAKPPAALKGHGLGAISGFYSAAVGNPTGQKKLTAFHTAMNVPLAL